MTKEQEEAIERLNRFKTVSVLYSKTLAIPVKNLKELQVNIETVLNMLKENSAEIEQKNTELAEKSAEIEKKDKQIDLMANYIVDLIKYNNPEEKREVEEIKQYFERKCEE